MAWERRTVLIGGQVRLLGARWQAPELTEFEGKQIYVRYVDEAQGALTRMGQGDAPTVSEVYFPEAWTNEADPNKRVKLATLEVATGSSVVNLGEPRDKVGASPEGIIVVLDNTDVANGALEAPVATALVPAAAPAPEGVVVVLDGADVASGEAFSYDEIGIEDRLAVQHSERVIGDNIAAIRTSTIAIGRELRTVRAKLQHGQWLRWLRDRNYFSHDTAMNFIAAAALADQYPQFAVLETMFSRMALRDLADEQVPDEVRTEALRRAGLNEKITPKKVAGIIARFTPAPAQPATPAPQAPAQLPVPTADVLPAALAPIGVQTERHGVVQVVPLERIADVALTPVLEVHAQAGLQPKDDEFQITYVPTGQALGPIITDEHKARLKLRALGEKVDWTQIVNGRVPRPIQRQLRSILEIPHNVPLPKGVAEAEIEALNARLQPAGYHLTWDTFYERFQISYPIAWKYDFFEPEDWKACVAKCEELLAAKAAATNPATDERALTPEEAAAATAPVEGATVLTIESGDVAQAPEGYSVADDNALFDRGDENPDGLLYGDVDLMGITALPGVSLAPEAPTHGLDERTRVIALYRISGQYQAILAGLPDREVMRIAATMWNGDEDKPWHAASRRDHERVITTKWCGDIRYELNGSDLAAVTLLTNDVGVSVTPLPTAGMIPSVDALPPDAVDMPRGSDTEAIHHRLTAVEYLINAGHALPAYNLSDLDAVEKEMQRAAEVIEESAWEWLMQRLGAARRVLHDLATTEAERLAA